MKLLFLTSQLPFPPHGGGVIKSYRLLEYLSERFSITLICNLKGNDIQHESALVEKVKLTAYHAVRIDRKRNGTGLLMSYLRSKTLNEWRNYSKEMMELTESCASGQDIILVDHYEMFQFVPKNCKVPVVLHTHNAEHVMWRRFAQLAQNSLKRHLIRKESARIKKAETMACTGSQLVWAAPEDIRALSATKESKLPEFAPTYHLGNDDFLELPPLKFDAAGKAVLFFGTLSWQANVDGLLWFITQIWPKVLIEEPEALLYIVGKEPPIELRKCAKKMGRIVFTGFVPDLDEHFVKCRAFVNPVRFGSGIKVKMLDAMYRGLPVVSSFIGAESLAINHGKDYFLANEDADWVKHITVLLNDAVVWKSISENARSTTRSLYRWKPLLTSHAAQLKHLVSNHQITAHVI